VDSNCEVKFLGGSIYKAARETNGVEMFAFSCPADKMKCIVDGYRSEVQKDEICVPVVVFGGFALCSRENGISPGHSRGEPLADAGSFIENACKAACS
jgi:hypothetical protein